MEPVLNSPPLTPDPLGCCLALVLLSSFQKAEEKGLRTASQHVVDVNALVAAGLHFEVTLKPIGGGARAVTLIMVN